MLCVLRHGGAAHKRQLLAEGRGHVAELLVHAEGSAVLQLLYRHLTRTRAPSSHGRVHRACS